MAYATAHCQVGSRSLYIAVASRRRNFKRLFHAEVFYNLASCNTPDVNPYEHHLSICWRHTHPGSLVCATRCPDNYNLVPFGNHVVYSNEEIRESSAVHHYALFDHP